MPRHQMPTRDRLKFTTTQVRDDYAKAYPDAIEDISREYGTEIIIMRKITGFGKYTKTFEEKAIFNFKANVIFQRATTIREYGPTDDGAATVYAPKNTLDALAAKDSRFTVRAGDIFLIDGTEYKLDARKPQGTFLASRGAVQFDITVAG